MTTLTFGDKNYACESDESVLECLTRHDLNIPSGCKNGVCQTCLMRAHDGTPPTESQEGLKPTLQKQGYFLACVCHPETDLNVSIAGDEAQTNIDAEVIEKTNLNDKILRLRLKLNSTFEYNAGQFINIHKDGLIRSYSIASTPQEDFIELHIDRLPNGKMSSALHNQLNVGETLTLDGPHGNCFYLDDKPEQNLLLIGTGSGLAPLWGIVRDALAQGHTGAIHLFHGGREWDKLYLMDELKSLAQQQTNFQYTPCVSGENVSYGLVAGRANDVALSQYPKLDGWRVFLCGHPDMVNDTKRKAFLAGASLQEILADPFEISSN